MAVRTLPRPSRYDAIDTFIELCSAAPGALSRYQTSRQRWNRELRHQQPHLLRVERVPFDFDGAVRLIHHRHCSAVREAVDVDA